MGNGAPCHGEMRGINRRRGRRDGGASLLRRVAIDWTRRPPLNGAAVHGHYSGRLLTSAGAEEMTTKRFSARDSAPFRLSR